MKVCFVGIGSIGRRHIRNLTEICWEKGIEIKIDALRRRETRSQDVPEQINHIYTDMSLLPKDYDAIFLTNPTEYHADMLIALRDNSRNFFIEKPVASPGTINKLKDFRPKDKSVYYVACPLRYTDVIRYLKENIKLETVNAIRAICSSYLPDWRPETDYRDSYSAHKKLGGGVDIDLIHEWDYITYLFGMPSDVKIFSGRVSKLDIDSNDYAIYIAQFNESMVAELHLDYFGRESIRALDVFTEEDTICCDLNKGRISYMKSGQVIELPTERDIYQKRELEYFIDVINTKGISQNEIAHAIKVLRLTQGLVD